MNTALMISTNSCNADLAGKDFSRSLVWLARYIEKCLSFGSESYTGALCHGEKQHDVGLASSEESEE
jgi:hypothetical protein